MQEVLLRLPADAPLCAPIRPNHNVLYRAIKRSVDVVASSLALFILSPIFFCAAIAIKLEDPKGRVFFSQLRVGKDGSLFRLYKFRSMVSGAEALKSLLMHQNEMDGPVFKMRDDPRVTKVGKVIRRLSIDECPQFLNVILGDLSLVGPRPLPVEEARSCDSWQRQRESVKPGLTCTWQISGRNQIDFASWMRMDIEYIANQSLLVDFLILLKTAPAVLMARGAS